MARTCIRGDQITDGTVQRPDLDVQTAGAAVVAKIVAGTNVTLSSTGPDAGTGDVTVNVSLPGGSTDPNALHLSGGTLTGNLTLSGGADLIGADFGSKIQRLTVMPAGYAENRPLNFRFDQDALRFVNRIGTATINAPNFTSQELDWVFSNYANACNLSGKPNPCSIEITGLNVGSCMPGYMYPFVVTHSPWSNQVGVKMELANVETPTTWATAYDGPVNDYKIAEYVRTGSNGIAGVRWTFSNLKNPGAATIDFNAYFRWLGLQNVADNAYKWNVMRGGDTMYGNLVVAPAYYVSGLLQGPVKTDSVNPQTTGATIGLSGTLAPWTLDWMTGMSAHCQPRVRINELHNQFWQADKRWTVTGGSTSLFDGSFDSWQTLVSGTNVVDVYTSGRAGLKSFTYPQGNVYVAFYGTHSTFDSISLQVSGNKGWIDCGTPANVVTTSNQNYKTLRFYVPPTFNYATEYKLTVVVPSGATCWLTEIAYVLDRWTVNDELPYVNKHAATNNLAGQLNVLTSTGAVGTFLTGGDSYFAMRGGKVGIGTASSAATLDVYGSARFGDKASNAYLDLYRKDDTTQNYLRWFDAPNVMTWALGVLNGTASGLVLIRPGLNTVTSWAAGDGTLHHYKPLTVDGASTFNGKVSVTAVTTDYPFMVDGTNATSNRAARFYGTGATTNVVVENTSGLGYPYVDFKNAAGSAARLGWYNGDTFLVHPTNAGNLQFQVGTAWAGALTLAAPSGVFTFWNSGTVKGGLTVNGTATFGSAATFNGGAATFNGGTTTVNIPDGTNEGLTINGPYGASGLGYSHLLISDKRASNLAVIDVMAGNGVYGSRLMTQGTRTFLNAETNAAGASINFNIGADNNGYGTNYMTLTSGGQLALHGNFVADSGVSGRTLASTVATGTAPLAVSSNTVCANLNADLLDGNEAAAFALAAHNHDAAYLKLAGGTVAGNLTVNGTTSVNAPLNVTYSSTWRPTATYAHSSTATDAMWSSAAPVAAFQNASATSGNFTYFAFNDANGYVNGMLGCKHVDHSAHTGILQLANHGSDGAYVRTQLELDGTLHQLYGLQVDGAASVAGDLAASGNISMSASKRIKGWTQSRTLNVENPGAAENLTFFYTRKALTLSSCGAVLVGGSSPSVTFQISYGSTRSAAGTNLWSSSQVCNSTGSGTAHNDFSNSSIPAGSWIWFKTSVSNGSPSQISVFLEYAEA